MDNEEESKSDKSIQIYAALGIGIVCILLGVPLWWKTTEVYRVSLPYDEIAQLAENQVHCVIRLNIVSFDESLSLNDINKLATDELNSKSASSSEYKSLVFTYIVNTRLASVEEKSLYSKSGSAAELDNHLHKLSAWYEAGSFNVLLIPASSHLKVDTNHRVILGRHRTAVVQPSADVSVAQLIGTVAKAVRDVIVSEARINSAVLSAWHTRKQQMDKETMRTVQYHEGFDITFTLINAEPSKQNVSWDISEASEKYFREILFKTRDYTNLQIKSQKLYYVDLGVQPRKASVGDYYYLTQDDLPHIINSVEGYLASHVSNNPQLNFLVYAVPPTQRQLMIVNQQGDFVKSNAFLIPRWGGMLIYNPRGGRDGAVAVGGGSGVDHHPDLPPPASATTDFSVDMRDTMEVFASQLRLLLGFQPHIASTEIAVAQPGYDLIHDWELDQWLRLRCVENTVLAVTVLQSLSDLLEKISNIVINDDIGREVTTAVQHIRQAMDLLGSSKLRDAFLASRRAIRSAEKAFFDPSLLELLYFPEDQKFAIYIPLFLPIGIPVVLSLSQAAKWFKTRHKTKAKSD